MLGLWNSRFLYRSARRMALMGDAISHGILLALPSHSFLEILWVWEVCFSVLALLGLPVILHRVASYPYSNQRRCSHGFGVHFLFAIGVTLISLQGEVHLDPECILYGEIGMVPLSESLYLFDVELETALCG